MLFSWRYKKGIRVISNQFIFSSEVENKLFHLNTKLTEEEQRIFPIYRAIEKHCKKMVLNKEIDDYEIELIVECWNDEHYKKFHPSIEGNPFFVTKSHFMVFQGGKKYIDYDENDLGEKSPFPNMRHCYTFHHLYDHCDLTWFDIYNIDEVWMEIKVRYQFLRKIN